MVLEMKLNKVVTGISALTLSALLLTACSSSSSKDSTDSKSKSSKVEKSSSKETTEAKRTAGGELKDGTYKLSETGYSNGYRAEMSMTVKDGKVSATTLDYVDKDGKSKKDDADYEKAMVKVSKTGPKEYIPELEKAFTKAGDNVASIETVSGATGTSTTFKNYAQQLVQAAQKGDTAEIKIDNTAKLKDGTYALEEKNYSHDYRVTLALTVAGGKVTTVKYDQINKDGTSKTKDAEYEKSMKKVNKIGPVEYIPQLAKNLQTALNSEKGLEGFEAVSGATHSGDSLLTYASQLLNAAQKGDTAKIEIDNIIYSE